MAQTTVNGLFVAASGHRFVMQSGTHRMATAATNVTMSVHMHRLVCAIVTPEQRSIAGLNTTAQIGNYIAYVSACELTIAGFSVPFRCQVSRLRAPAGLKFSYSFVGW